MVGIYPDHPWADPSGADEKKNAVRIAMTGGAAGRHEGGLLTVVKEEPVSDGAAGGVFATALGTVATDLAVGADVASTAALEAIEGLASRGVLAVNLFGPGAGEARRQFRKVYDHVLAAVKPERDQNNERPTRSSGGFLARPGERQGLLFWKTWSRVALGAGGSSERGEGAASPAEAVQNKNPCGERCAWRFRV
ncbi:MAG: hypothetical protein HY302_16910 [Opitutae bacterium]|nr:hypothetical protein [Opitutae bacterium]